MDVLSEILSSIKASGSVYFCDRLESPWRMEKKSSAEASFHYVRRGQCWLEFNGEKTLLGPGDLVFIGKGDAHILSNDVSSVSQSDYPLETFLLCGYFDFRYPIPTPLNDALPSLLLLRSDDIEERPWLKLTLSHLSMEYDSQTPGAMLVVDKLTEIVLVELIRFHLKSVDSNNFVAAMFDPQIGQALVLLHQHPEQAWTLSSLAERVAMSRAAFARRFTGLVGQPMFQYLTAVRMRMAANLLRDYGRSVADIAEAVGYSSDMAFSKVFKDSFSQTPLAWRKAQHASMLKKR